MTSLVNNSYFFQFFYLYRPPSPHPPPLPPHLPAHRWFRLLRCTMYLCHSPRNIYRQQRAPSQDVRSGWTMVHCVTLRSLLMAKCSITTCMIHFMSQLMAKCNITTHTSHFMSLLMAKCSITTCMIHFISLFMHGQMQYVHMHESLDNRMHESLHESAHACPNAVYPHPWVTSWVCSWPNAV